MNLFIRPSLLCLSVGLIASLAVACDPQPRDKDGGRVDGSPKPSRDPSGKGKSKSPSESPDAEASPSAKDPSNSENSPEVTGSSSKGEESPEPDQSPEDETGDTSESESSPGSGTGSGSGSGSGSGDCGNIAWGDKWAVGEVVPISAVVGLRDTDGDQILDSGTSKFDMCDLHRSGKRCAVITRGHRR